MAIHFIPLAKLALMAGKAGLSNPTINTCGDDTGLYGDGNEYRRLLSMSTFITTM